MATIETRPLPAAPDEPGGPGGPGAGPDAVRPPTRWGAGALAGFVAAGLALAVVAAVGRLLPDTRPLDISVGDVVIRNAPSGLVHWAIEVFGTNDKPALRVGIVLTALVAGAVVGAMAARWRLVGPVAFLAAAVAGLIAATRDPQSDDVRAAFAAALGAIAGAVALDVLLARPDGLADAAARRRFLRLTGSVATGGVAVALLSRLRTPPSKAEEARAEIDLDAAPGVAPAGASFAVVGLTPLVTPNDDFYRIDTALAVPDVDPDDWTLTVHGMVGQTFALSYSDLIALPTIEHWTTIACVSNEVGGRLVGNAHWLGTPLAGLLDRAGVDPREADQLVGRSIDGFTVGFPTALALDGRAAMVAYGMNDEPLPRVHGFPARLIVPGLYGYVSATKWLTEIELTTWDAFDAYWVPRGWAKEGPVKTQSRIDVPRGDVPPGATAIAGVAWAPTRGIAKVEVQVADGPWQEAELADELHVDTWRQWRLTWDAQPGSYTVRVRATDGDGVTQDERRTAVAPDGAQGWHSVRVHVDG
jgi:DMSO/TMAO reductase YedYZ molybdopterin-dependent catalytic subunit